MIILKKVPMLMLMAVLLLEFVPLWGRTVDVQPCQYTWQYAIAYRPRGTNLVPPEDAFPGFPPRCMRIMDPSRLYL